MEDQDNDASGIFGGTSRSAEELSVEFNEAMAELGWTPVELAERLISLGDYREYKTILRGIHRAVEGQVKLSGELLAFVRQEVRYKRRLKRAYEHVEWTQVGDGSWTAKAEEFILNLQPQTKQRWKVHMTHSITGYSPSWPRWQDSLPAAKEMAFLTLDSAMNWLLEQEQQEESRRPARPRRAIQLD